MKDKKLQPKKKEWPKESAGRSLTDKVPTVLPSSKLEKVRKYVLSNVKRFDTVNYVYAVDEKGKLVGVCSIKEIYRHQPEEKISAICKKGKEVVKARPTVDQERVVYLAVKNNIKAIPVVGEKGVFLGVVPSDKILSILYKETREDLLHIAGISRSIDQLNVLEVPLLKSYKYRVPWLIIGLFGGLLAARIIGAFEATLAENLLLAAFIPLMVYISNAVAVQGQTLLIRDLASSIKLPYLKYILRQGSVSFLIALTVSFIFYLVSLAGLAPAFIGLVIALAMLVSINVATLLGMLVPILLKRVKVDPALGSGPLSTILQDTMTIIVYFTVASLLLR